MARGSGRMKNFASPSFRLRDASFEIRLVYSLFLAFIIAGLATTWVFQFARIGLNYQRIAAYYLGGEIDGQMFFPKNINALLEETHFHAFMMSVVFLILSHLFLGTFISRRLKLFFILITFFSHFLDMGSTWLIRTWSPFLAYTLLASWIGLWIGYSGMILIPLYEMWLPKAGTRRQPAAGADQD
jgi:hypothetical protein